MKKIKPKVSIKLIRLRSFNISAPDMPKVCQTMKNIKAGTIIYATLKTNNRRVSYIFFAKLTEGIAEDSFKPILTMENKYPGTIRINTKNANAPKIVTYLLSNANPIGIIAANINRTKRIGNFLRFLKGYFIEFDTILPTSI